MNAYLLPISLQIVALLVVVTEIFIPSLGILTLIALSLFIYSLYIVYTSISTTVGVIFTIIDITMVPLILLMGVKILASSPLALKRELSKETGVESQQKDIKKYVNMTGTAITDLRPAGIAQIESHRLDVVTDAEYIQAGTPVIVTGATGNRIIVEETK